MVKEKTAAELNKEVQSVLLLRSLKLYSSFSCLNKLTQHEHNSFFVLFDQSEDWKANDAPTDPTDQFYNTKGLLFAQHALRRLSRPVLVSPSHIGHQWSQDSLCHKLIALLKLKTPPGVWISIIFLANKSFHHRTLSASPYLAFGCCAHTHKTAMHTNE